MAYTGRNTTLYYSSPEEVVSKGNFLPGDIRSDWDDDNETDFDTYLISILTIVKEIIDRDRNINFSDEVDGVPEVIHLVATFLGFYLIKDSSDTQSTYIKNNEEVRIYTRQKMFDDNVRNLLNSIPKRVISGAYQNSLRIKTIKSGIPKIDVIKWY